MPKRSGGGSAKGRFELGGFWLGREGGRPSWYRYWYDERTGRVRRQSLGTEDFEKAKQALASYVVSRPRGTAVADIPDPHRVLFVAVVDHYLEHRAKGLRSGAQAERAAELVYQFLFQERKLPETAKADCFGLDLQQEFVVWAARTFGHSAAYIARLLNPIAAAMHFAAEEQSIEYPDEGVRTVRLMNAAPKIRYDAAWIAEKAKIAPPRKRDWIPSYQELGSFIDCIRSEHLFRFVILVLNTWARAETIMSIDLKRQVNTDSGTLDLNPPGRLQTKKRRPIIRLTRNLAAWRTAWKVARPLVFRGEEVGDLRRAMQATNARWMMHQAGIDPERIERLMGRGAHKECTAVIQELDAKGAHRITRRVIRTFMATRVRGQKEIKVDREQRQIWLGHLSQDTTAGYEVSDPDYLREAADATDLVIDRIGEHCRRSLWPAGSQLELPFAGRPPEDQGDLFTPT